MTPTGRPEIGPTITIRLTDEIIATADAIAARRQISRAEAIRQLVEVGIKHQAELLNNVDFAAYLRDRMAQSGIQNSAELSRRIGVSQSTVARWLLGQSRPDSRMQGNVDAAFAGDRQ